MNLPISTLTCLRSIAQVSTFNASCHTVLQFSDLKKNQPLHRCLCPNASEGGRRFWKHVEKYLMSGASEASALGGETVKRETF